MKPKKMTLAYRQESFSHIGIFSALYLQSTDKFLNRTHFVTYKIILDIVYYFACNSRIHEICCTYLYCSRTCKQEFNGIGTGCDTANTHHRDFDSLCNVYCILRPRVLLVLQVHWI